MVHRFRTGQDVRSSRAILTAMEPVASTESLGSFPIARAIFTTGSRVRKSSTYSEGKRWLGLTIIAGGIQPTIYIERRPHSSTNSDRKSDADWKSHARSIS